MTFLRLPDNAFGRFIRARLRAACLLALLGTGFSHASVIRILDSTGPDFQNTNSPIYDFDRTGSMDTTQFIGQNFDWSGVGRTTNRGANDQRWGTLIDSRHFLSASHFHPGVNDTLQFFVHDSSTGALLNSYTRTVTAGQPVEFDASTDTDIWVGRLDTPLPSSVNAYEILQAPFNSVDWRGLGSGFESNENGSFTNYPNITDDILFVVGQSPAGNEAIRVGTNTSINSLAAITLGHTFATGFTGEKMDFSYSQIVDSTNHETIVESGDSGAPTFWAVSGNSPDATTGYYDMKLVGIHSAGSPGLGQQEDSVIGVTNFTYLTQIQDFIDAAPPAVPEPGHTAAILGAVGLLLVWQSRRRA